MTRHALTFSDTSLGFSHALPTVAETVPGIRRRVAERFDDRLEPAVGGEASVGVGARRRCSSTVSEKHLDLSPAGCDLRLHGVVLGLPTMNPMF